MSIINRFNGLVTRATNAMDSSIAAEAQKWASMLRQGRSAGADQALVRLTQAVAKAEVRHLATLAGPLFKGAKCPVVPDMGKAPSAKEEALGGKAEEVFGLVKQAPIKPIRVWRKDRLGGYVQVRA